VPTTTLLPMLAKPYDPRKHDTLLKAGHLVVEEKFDGHRCIVRVEHGEPIKAWSRTGIDCRNKLASHLLQSLRSVPNGVYDCELLLPGGKSTDVTRLEVQHRLHLVVFDLLELNGDPVFSQPWSARRELLAGIDGWSSFVYLSHVEFQVRTPQLLEAFVSAIWEKKGEGVIVKDKRARYEPGKRRDAFLKIKDCGTTVVTVVGFEAGTTTDSNVVVFRDDDGNVCKCKVVNDEWRAKVAADPDKYIGRRLRIEFHERTPDGSYRHPRWDRWEDE
jgi:ATP-dependent DNA ligase